MFYEMFIKKFELWKVYQEVWIFIINHVWKIAQNCKVVCSTLFFVFFMIVFFSLDTLCYDSLHLETIAYEMGKFGIEW